MKNVCVVVKNSVTATTEGDYAPIKVFSRCGYPVEEIRILPIENVDGLRKSVAALSKEYDVLLLVAEKGGLPALRILLQSTENTSLLAEYGGAGIYKIENATLFLLSADETATGTGFVESACIPHLQQTQGRVYERTVLRTVGANEGRVGALVAEGERRGGGKIRFSRERSYDEEIISIFYDDTAPKMIVDSVVRLFADELTESLYAMEDGSLEERLVKLLKLRGKKLSVAESFTGGGIARRITSVSGASEVYFEGLNTYAEESKTKRLGVSQYGLRTTGAVSDQTAYEMALGLLNTGDCDIAIATTGLAGPKSDRSMLPVGLSYIAVGTKEKIFVYRYKFEDGRREITEKAINYALFLAYKVLKNL